MLEQKQKTFQISLRAARVNAGLTQEEAADRLDLHVNTYMKLEKNPGLTSARYQRAISETFNIPIDNINFAR